MRSKKITHFSTSFAAFFIAVFMIGSTSQSIEAPEKSKANELTVVSTSPSDGEEDVARNVVIEVTFSESMESESLQNQNSRESESMHNQNSMNSESLQNQDSRESATYQSQNSRESATYQNATFTLKQGNETVKGTFEYSGNRGLFKTETPLKANTEYTASLSMDNNNQTDRSQSDNDNLNNEFNDDYSTNEFNDDENAENSENHYASNGNEWTFTTGGNSEPVETVDLGSAANYVILAQTSIQNDSTSEITGERGFDPEFKSSKDKENKTAYWLNNEDVDKEEVRREKEEGQKDKNADRTEKQDAQKDADRRDATTLENSDTRDFSANEGSMNADNLDEALEDMIAAYTDAAERTSIDFVDYDFNQSSDQAEATWNNDRDDQNEMNATESRWEDNDQDDQDNSEEEKQRDNEMIHHSDSDMNHNRDGSEMNHNRTASDMHNNMNESSVTLEPGIYKWNESVEISSDITLSGNADDVWIFQISEGLTVNRDVEVTLGNGAVAENVIWQVAGEVNIGESSHFEGIILSLTGITMKNGASLNGRMLAQTDITLDENTIMEPQVFASARTSSNE